MVQSLTDWLQQSRVVVVGVDLVTRRVRVKSEADACTDLSCNERTLVVTDEGAAHSLATLNPGDIVRVEEKSGRPERIVVVRRVWEELTSPEW
jgi:hypothetical protein